MTERHSCAGRVWDGAWRKRECENRGKLFEDGKWWCHSHAPSQVAARREKWNAKYSADNAKEREHLRREAAMCDVCSGVETDELEQLGIGGLKRLLIRPEYNPEKE